MNPPSLKRLRTEPIWVGIDPGASGAIGAIDNHGRFLWVHDMPISELGRRGEFDVEEIATIARSVNDWPLVNVILEWPQTRPDEAPESSKRFGVGLGILEACFTMVGHPPKRVAANKWKGRLNLGGKEGREFEARSESVCMAESVIVNLPAGALRGPRGGLKDGRAEALLIAWEEMTNTLAGLRNLPEDLMIGRLLCGPKSSRRRRGGGPVI